MSLPAPPPFADFARPERSIVWMLIVLAQAAIVAALFWQPLTAAFLFNPWFNGVIVAVFALGVLVAMFQVLRLKREIRWLEAFSRRAAARPPVLLAPLAHQLESLQAQNAALTPTAARAILDGVQIRLEEQRDLSRYLTGLLVFLGLLGTFWGLIGTIRAVAEIIQSLSVEGDAAQIFATLKAHIEAPLAAMGTAFSTSLFGLAGSLLLGLLDLQAGHAVNRFYNELEEWLAGQVRVIGVLGADEEAPSAAYLTALLAQTAEQLEKLRRIVQVQASEQHGVAAQLTELNAQMSKLIAQMSRETREVEAIADLQSEIQALIRQVAQLPTQQREAFEEVRAELHLLVRALSSRRSDASTPGA